MGLQIFRLFKPTKLKARLEIIENMNEIKMIFGDTGSHILRHRV